MEKFREEYQEREQQLNRWIENYSQPLLNTCFYMLSDHSQVEYAVQDTLITAWRYLARQKNHRIANERAWLLRIAANTCRDYTKSETIRYIHPTIPLEEPPLKLLRFESKDSPIVFLGKDLPKKCRQVILLHYFQGMTEEEIASFLEVSESTVSKNLRRAEKLIRDQFGK